MLSARLESSGCTYALTVHREIAIRTIISARFLASKGAQPRSVPFEATDTRTPGFKLRVQPSGVRTYYAQLGRSRRIKIASVGVLTPDEARERCQLMIGNAAHGRDPMQGIDGAASLTLGQFVKATYDPWLRANRPKTAAQSLQRLETLFGNLFSKPLESIDVLAIEKWKTDRIASGTKPSTIVRDIFTLSPVLSRAVKFGKLGENILRKVDKPRLDRTPKVRYLSADEGARLRAALKARDKQMRQSRDSGNRWRKARGKELLPRLGEFADHLEPAILVALNTGLRSGDLRALKWSNVNFAQKLVAVEGSDGKSAQSRYIPLNTEALAVLKRWKPQSVDDRIFPFGSFKTAWAPLLKQAQIKNFRWHDMRHDFASRLVSKGVPLNTVRELLGQGSLAMTLRYAHLAPDHKAEAVARLNTT
jgi:integrase